MIETAHHNPSKKGDWLTNNPQSIKSLEHVLRCRCVEGPPHATMPNLMTEASMVEKGYVGIYLDEDVEGGYYSLPKRV